MVSPAPDARPSPRNSTAFEPRLCHRPSLFPGNGISRPEKKAPKRPPNPNGRISRDQALARKPANSAAIRQSPGNLRKRETAWWAREDSNLQPDRYERTSRSGRPRITKHLRSRSTTFIHVWCTYFIAEPLAGEGAPIRPSTGNCSEFALRWPLLHGTESGLTLILWAILPPFWAPAGVQVALVAGARNLLYRTRTEWRRRIKRPLLQPVV